MQGNFHPWALLLGRVQEIGVDAAENRLVGDNDHIFAALQLHDNRFQSDDNVAVRLAAPVAIVVLVLVARGKILGVFLRDILIGEPVADTRVELVKSLPL